MTAVEIHGGEIEKMIEDRVMIVFADDSSTASQNASAGVKVAISIQKAMQQAYNLTMAAGINSGEVISGVMGAKNVRLSKTVVGDSVNLSARLASVALALPDGGLVASGKIAGFIDKEFNCQKLPINRVKGKIHTVDAYLVSA